MRTDEVRDFLRQRGARGKEGPIQNGTQFRCESGEVINVYDTGKVVIGGKQGDLAKALLAISIHGNDDVVRPQHADLHRLWP
jgi:hypothetical protein